MNKNVLSVGLKVLVAVASGVAVFMGIQKAVDCNSQPQQPRCPQGQPQNPQQSNNVGQNNNLPTKNESSGQVFLDSIRASQDTCGKVSVFLQSVSGVAESLMGLFGKNSPYQPRGNYYPSSGGMYRPNDFIICTGPRYGGGYNSPPMYDNNNGKYPY